MDPKKIRRYMTVYVTEKDASNKEQLDADLYTDFISGELTNEEYLFLQKAYDLK